MCISICEPIFTFLSFFFFYFFFPSPRFLNSLISIFFLLLFGIVLIHTIFFFNFLVPYLLFSQSYMATSIQILPSLFLVSLTKTIKMLFFLQKKKKSCTPFFFFFFFFFAQKISQKYSSYCYFQTQTTQ